MITIVTGFGRCGSSLVMQMLEAGGIPCTGEYPAFECELGAALLDDALTLAMMESIEGHAVKLLDAHRGTIPRGPEYRVVWMSRDHTEQGKSQAKFFSALMGTGVRLGRDAARSFAKSYGPDTPKLEAALKRAGASPALQMAFEYVLREPVMAAQHIARHVGIEPERIPDMAFVVRPRSPECAPDLSMELSLIAERESA